MTPGIKREIQVHIIRETGNDTKIKTEERARVVQSG